MVIVEDVMDGKTGNRNSSDAVHERVDLVMNALVRLSDARGWCGVELYIFICGDAAAH